MRTKVRSLLVFLMVCAAMRAVNSQSLKPHPRMILTGDTLARLRQKVNSQPEDWNSLHSSCEALASSRVLYFDETGTGIGEGYQGGEYFNALMSLGLCRQVVKQSDGAAAERYGQKMADILRHMSDPARSPDPGRDNGYGLRFYGTGMAYAYDWAYDVLDEATKAKVWTALNRWIRVFETDPCCDWEWAHPNSNYFASYYHAKAAAAIATEGDNPEAVAMWRDWIEKEHGARVQPYFAKYLDGGGWPEGFPNYGPFAVLNHALVVWSVETAKGIDLIHGKAPYLFPIESADYLMHFTWPGLGYTDDRGTAHAVKASERPAGVLNEGVFVALAGLERLWGAANAPVLQEYAEEVHTSVPMLGSVWQRFLFWDEAAPKQPLKTLPLSYFAPGLNHVAARSEWSRSATWLSFVAGTYVNNPAQGEQRLEQGSLALVRENTPLLVNATAWLEHNTPGTADGERDEQFVHLDNYGKFAKDPHLGNRSIYNVFYVRHVDANGTPEEPYGQAANGPTGPSTQIAEFEDSGAFVYAEAKHLEDMYRVSREGPLVEKWTRRIVFARPNRVIVFDETAAGEADADQFMAWNFSGEPLAADDAARRDIRYGNDFAGSVTQVLPEGAKGTCVNLFSANKVWQLQVRPGTKARLQTWITVFDLSESREAVAVAKAIPVREGRAAGVLIAPRGSQASATLFVTQPFDNAGPDTIRYVIPGRSTRHLITGLHGGSRYFVACARDGADITVSVKGGGAITASGGFIASSAGVLSFATSESGEVR